jgi:hypothetical protein
METHKNQLQKVAGILSNWKRVRRRRRGDSNEFVRRSTRHTLEV